MATRPKIKILDDVELRRMLDEEYEKSSQVKLCKYAFMLAAHILTTAAYNDIDNPIIKAGYAVNESWQNGTARMHDVRQAVATGHMREHAMVSSDFAVKVINLCYPNDMNAVRQERLWQMGHLRDIED